MGTAFMHGVPPMAVISNALNVAMVPTSAVPNSQYALEAVPQDAALAMEMYAPAAPLVSIFTQAASACLLVQIKPSLVGQRASNALQIVKRVSAVIFALPAKTDIYSFPMDMSNT